MGRYYWSNRRTVEECRTLRIAYMVSDRIILQGDSSYSSGSLHRISWPNGFEAIGQYHGNKNGGGTLRLFYTIRGERIEDHIEITSIPSPLRSGRRRYFLLCPGLADPCGRRVGKLYLPPGEGRFACRDCHNLTYRSSKKHDRRLGLFRRLPQGELARALKSPDWSTKFRALRAARELIAKS
jgi:hypothetical protein